METTKKQFYDDYEGDMTLSHDARSEMSRGSVEIDYKKNKLVNIVSATPDSMTEELCKFFDKMVYQLEIITK
jgi:hypothetical protein